MTINVKGPEKVKELIKIRKAFFLFTGKAPLRRAGFGI